MVYRLVADNVPVAVCVAVAEKRPSRLERPIGHGHGHGEMRQGLRRENTTLDVGVELPGIPAKCFLTIS